MSTINPAEKNFRIEKSEQVSVTGSSETRGEKVIRFKARASLTLIWIAASVICLFFAFFSFYPALSPANITNNSFLKSFQKDLLSGTSDLQSSNNKPAASGTYDAFVFVNMDKHFFLTHFPSGAAEDASIDGNDEKKNTGPNEERTGTRVIRKIKTIYKLKASVDFDVKPVPQ